MTNEFKYLMYLFACGANGTNPNPPNYKIDWEQLIRLADNQAISTTVAYALKRSDLNSCPNELKDKIVSNLRSAAINSCMKKILILELLHSFELEGIHAVVLKGFAVAECYAAPECRISGDTDIYIDIGNELRAYELLRNHGFTVTPRAPKAHHAVCFHPQMGCLELHVILYDEIVEDIWFKGLDDLSCTQEQHDLVTTKEGTYYTLGKTDHLIFLALHMIKHFIISGMSLRMMMDTALFIKHNKSELDMNRFWLILNKLKYNDLMNTLFGAMIQYCEFTADDFPGMSSFEPQNVAMVLDDLETGGWLGVNNKVAREDGWVEYNRQKLILQKSALYYKAYMFCWSSAIYWPAIFPKRDTLALRYPYVNKHILLVPYAWCHRLIFRGMKRLFAGRINPYFISQNTELSDSGKARMKMFRDLGMI